MIEKGKKKSCVVPKNLIIFLQTHQMFRIMGGSPESLGLPSKIGRNPEKGLSLSKSYKRKIMTNPFFWATHQGAEIDLILRRGTDLVGIECKRNARMSRK